MSECTLTTIYIQTHTHTHTINAKHSNKWAASVHRAELRRKR